MTQSDFTAFYPQFAGFTPAVVLTEYIRQSNARFTGFDSEDAEEARRNQTDRGGNEKINTPRSEA